MRQPPEFRNPDVQALVRDIAERYVTTTEGFRSHDARVRLGKRRDVLQRLVQHRVLQFAGDYYFPCLRGIEYIGPEATESCKQATELVLVAAKSIFETRGPGQYTVEQLLEEAHRIDNTVSARQIRLGMGLAYGFRLTSGAGMSEGKFTNLGVAENILDFETLEEAQQDEMALVDKFNPDLPADSSPNEQLLDPWGPVSSMLFEFSSDEIPGLAGVAGIAADWSLSERDAYSHGTRKRAYRSRIEEKYHQLGSEQQRLVTLNLAREIAHRDPEKAHRLNEALKRIGWAIDEGVLVPLQVVTPSDLASLPEQAHQDMLKALDRLPHDLSGAVSAACAAVDSVTARVFEAYNIGDHRGASFQERVNRSVKALGVLDVLANDLRGLGWDEVAIKEFCGNLKKALSHAAKIMEKLRPNMGDMHGTQPVLTNLVYDSIRWAMIICSLLRVS